MSGQAKLQPLNGPLREEVTLTGTSTLIGRSNEADICVDQLEERHARLTRQNGDFVVEDLLSRARGGATLQELSARLGDSAGAERAAPLPLRRDAAPFETSGGGEEE